MRRRTFVTSLATGSALVAGCSGLPGDDDGDPGNETDGQQPSNGEDENDEADFWQPAGDLQDERLQEPTVVDFETASVTAAVPNGQIRTDDRIVVSLDFEQGATADAPATLVATVVNGKPFEQTVRARRLLVLADQPRGRTRDRDQVSLAPTEDHPLAEMVPEYERDEDGRWRLLRSGGDWFPETVTIGAEQGFIGRYYLLAGSGHDDAPVGPGRYEFTWRGTSLTIAAWSTDEPGPAEPSRFAGADVPALPRKDVMAWYHDATAETAVHLEPDIEAVDLPAAVTFALVNRGDEQARGNPYFWRLHKLVDDQWFPVYPWEWPSPASAVRPGGREESTVGLYHGDPVRDEHARSVGHLGGGRYAYETGYSVGKETHAAMVDVDAPAVTVDIEDDAVVVESSDTAVVELPNHEDARRQARFVVEPADGEGIDRRLIPEQLPRRPFRGFRNALPVLESGAERVEVRTDRGTALRPFGYEENVEQTVAYRGEAYRATGELLD